MNIWIIALGLFVISFGAICHKLWNMELRIFESTIEPDEFSVVNIAFIALGLMVLIAGIIV